MALDGRRVAALMANEGVEQVELTGPADAIRDAGGTVDVIAPEAGTVQAFHHLDRGDTFPVDQVSSEVSVDDYDALLLPGGVASADQLRTDPKSVRLVRQFVESGKPVAVICHGPWTLIEAGAVDGRRLTSWPSLSTDLTKAGGQWVDEEVVVDTSGPGPLISSRKPDDLPAFCRELLAALESAPAAAATAGASEVPAAAAAVGPDAGSASASPDGHAADAVATVALTGPGTEDDPGSGNATRAPDQDPGDDSDGSPGEGPAGGTDGDARPAVTSRG